MNKVLRKLYYIFWLPVSGAWHYIGVGFCTLMICFTIVSSFAISSFFSHPIFKSNPADLYAIEEWQPVDNTQILDRDGNVISEQFNHYHVYVPYNEIPKKVIDSILAIEDRKFWNHKGMDIFAIMRAGSSYMGKGKIRQGASTLTQQIVKNLVLSKEKTFSRKIREIVLSLYLETFVSKEKILEIYCNSMFLGNGSYGVAAAAKRYFGKELKDLDYHETSLIAGLFQSPGKYNPAKHPSRAKERQLIVLKAMLDNKVFDENDYEKYKTEELPYKEYESSYGKVAPYFVDYVMEEAEEIIQDKGLSLKGSGLKIYTTLNAKLDNHAQETFTNSKDLFDKMKKHIIFDNKPRKDDQEDVQGALLAIDRKTGEIVTMIGGKDYKSSQYNRVASALRAPGSVFKTFVYALGLKQGIDWNKQYFVAPVTIGNYRPRTQHSQLFSETTLFESFYKSINSTAVLLGQEVGIEKVLSFAGKLGVETPLKEEAATFLGGSEVTMLDMGRAYLTIANEGFRKELYAITKIEDRDGEVLFEREEPKEKPKRILNRKTYALIKEGLKSVVRHGTGYKVRHLSSRAAGKTGTSNKSKDNWFCGFTKDLVIITWMGNDDQNSFRGYISASNTAAPLWARFANKSIKQLKSGWLKKGRGLSFAKVHPKFGHLDKSGILMPFLPHRVPKESESDLMLLEEGKQLRVGMNDL